MVKFKKLDKFSYIIEEGLDILIDEAKNYLRNISEVNGKYLSDDTYAKFTNDRLFLEILSRLISKHFYNTENIENDILMCSIMFKYEDREYHTSIGYMEDISDANFNKKLVDGLLVK